jgi:osmotically-inducible protein OsmY
MANDNRNGRDSMRRDGQGYWGDRGYRGDRREHTGYSRGYSPSGGFDSDFRTGGSMRTGYGQGPLDERRQGQGGHRGRGPVGYQRSDDRIWELVCEALTDNDYIDATAIEVTVKDGEVTLAGTIPERYMKRLAEDCVEDISGVGDVQNQLKVGSGPGHPSASTESRRETETKHRA